ncbi:putative MFS family arabinose efflux permease [Saccharothrix carnea]|uniref:Putative MFS family arabinose efflux permease n=1 Tax=Saccharothrix carnea TaxID=1280637 RepID=A0A2P8I6D5_SACCR|nr:MFS transporter [Saccharothrix carnea]PSL54013.1 putative MFS family arabinose efflux permease [Saccharothrix carnea]
MTPPRPEDPSRRYPWEDDEYKPRTRPYPTPGSPPPPDPPPHGRPTPPRDQHGQRESARFTPPPDDKPTTPTLPKKLTVTRVAWFRTRQLSSQALATFRKAAHADGAKQSGLSSLTYAVMLNYAADAAMAVALANTLFFSAATGESRGKVALYLLITVAPFALVAPVIGPALDRIQHGRRVALAASCVLRVFLSITMALNFDNWGLYPAALGSMVLSKSFTVLKAAITPRVLPREITLSKTNARMTVFGLAAGGVFGAVAAGFANLFGSPGALWFTAVLCLANAYYCLRIPSWVEVTEGEVPASLRAKPQKPKRQALGRTVVVALWGNGSIRMLTGFLMLFAAFVVRAQTEGDALMQVLLLGVIAAAAGIGSFLGNAVGARLHFGSPDQVVIGCLTAALATVIIAAVLPGLATAAAVGLIGATASSLAKVSLDAVIQDDVPDESRASAFGRSETILQLGWVFGGALGVLLPTEYWIGFTVLAVLLAVGLAQTVQTKRGATLIPGLGGDRPLRPAPVVPRAGT